MRIMRIERVSKKSFDFPSFLLRLFALRVVDQRCELELDANHTEKTLAGGQRADRRTAGWMDLVRYLPSTILSLFEVPLWRKHS